MSFIHTIESIPFPALLSCTKLSAVIANVHQKTGAQIDFITLDLLSSLAAAGQRCYVIKRHDGRLMNLGLFCIGAGRTGSRKTTVMKLLSEPFVEFDTKQQLHNEGKKSLSSVRRRVHKKVLSKLADMAAIENINGNNSEELEHQMLEAQIELEKINGQFSTYLTSNPTPKALMQNLGRGLKCAYYLNSEAAKIVKGKRFVDSTPDLNDIWSGFSINQDKAENEKNDTTDARLTIFFGLQDTELKAAIKKHGDVLLGNGFFPRAIICNSSGIVTNQYFTNITANDDDALKMYAATITEMLEKSLRIQDLKDFSPTVIELTEEAEKHLQNFEYEFNLQRGPGGKYHKADNLLNKLYENITKVSGSLQLFEHGGGKVGLGILIDSINLCLYYAHQTIPLLIAPPQHVIDAEVIFADLKMRVIDQGLRYLYLPTYKKYCPNSARGRGRFDAAIRYLHDNHWLAIKTHCGKEVLDLFPSMDDDPMSLHFQLEWITFPGLPKSYMYKFPTKHKLKQIHEMYGMSNPGVPTGMFPQVNTFPTPSPYGSNYSVPDSSI